jgi:hypothetical protein
VTVRPDEAAAVVAAYDAVLFGVPLREIARTWNAQGFTTGQARYKAGHKGEPSPWRADSVRAVLKNPRNIGKRVYKGKIVADAVWPKIVAPERFEAVKAMLENPARRSGIPTGRALLSGLALCGICGATVHAGGAARAGIRNYRCSGSTGHVARKAEPVEDYVEAAVVGILSRPSAALLLQDRSRPDAEALGAEAVGLRERADALAAEYQQGRLLLSSLQAANKLTMERLAAIDKELADAGRVDILGPLVGAADVLAAWEALGTSRKRAVLDILMTVVIHPPGRGTRIFDPATVELIPKEQR